MPMNEVEKKIQELMAKYATTLTDTRGKKEWMWHQESIAAALREMHTWDEVEQQVEAERLRRERDGFQSMYHDTKDDADAGWKKAVESKRQCEELRAGIQAFLSIKRARECKHDAEYDYCDACLYEWQKEISAGRQALAALLTPPPVHETAGRKEETKP